MLALANTVIKLAFSLNIIWHINKYYIILKDTACLVWRLQNIVFYLISLNYKIFESVLITVSARRVTSEILQNNKSLMSHFDLFPVGYNNNNDKTIK